MRLINKKIDSGQFSFLPGGGEGNKVVAKTPTQRI
jgi:hypothetical protein